MKVVWKETPRIDNEISLKAEAGKTLYKIIAVQVIAKYVRPLDAPAHYMM